MISRAVFSLNPYFETLVGSNGQEDGIVASFKEFVQRIHTRVCFYVNSNTLYLRNFCSKYILG